MNQRERMLNGLPYKAWLDGLEEDRQACKQKIYDFNQLPPSRQSKEAPQMIKNIFGKTGENVWVEAPFHCDYGWNIEVGENFYSNYNLTILDVGKVTLGKNVQIAPNVSIYTAGHPVHPDSRNSGYEYGIPVTVGDRYGRNQNCMDLRNFPTSQIFVCAVYFLSCILDPDYYYAGDLLLFRTKKST